MSVVPFPQLRRLPIEGRNDIAAIEGVICSVAGVIAATGGAAALAGRDLFGTSAEGRAVLLTDMYEAGEVVFGWRDGRDGAVVNVALERVEVSTGGLTRRGWRAQLYVEEREGHALRALVLERDLNAIGRRLLEAANHGPPDAADSAAAALDAFLSDEP
jgi:hypothetical protein